MGCVSSKRENTPPFIAKNMPKHQPLEQNAQAKEPEPKSMREGEVQKEA